MGLFLCYLAVSLAHPSHVMSGVSVTQWSFSWLQTALSKNGIMYFEDQDPSQEPNTGSAVMVHREVGGAMNCEPARPNYPGQFGCEFFSLALYGLHLCFSARALDSSPVLHSVQPFLLFHAHGSKWRPPPQWPPQPQCEISKRLTNILESPFRQPWLGRWRGMWNHRSQLWCLDPWEVQFLKHGAWGLDP